MLKPKEVFVFGSNLSGRHGAGAAKTAALRFGAIYGQGYGLQGRSYGIPTKGFCSSMHSRFDAKTLSVSEIEKWINKFIKFADNNKDIIFLVTEIGCGLAGYLPEQIAPMFKKCLEMENVYLPRTFINFAK